MSSQLFILYDDLSDVQPSRRELSANTEVQMDSKHVNEKETVDLGLMSPAERSIFRQDIVRRARIARAAAISKAFRSLARAVARPFAAAYGRLQRRRLESQAVAELRAFSDYALSDLGITRSEIRQRVQLPDIPGAAVSASKRSLLKCLSRQLALTIRRADARAKLNDRAG
jgi:uncharacterized protein YjiS (DUF1127 family)